MGWLNRAVGSLVVIPSDLSRRSGLSDIKLIHSTTAILSSNMTNSDQQSKRTAEAREILKKSNIVCFDVDSTVITEEGIDELANFCGKGEEVQKLTKEAMSGSMTFQEALKLRLDIIRPSQKQIKEYLLTHSNQFSKGIRELMSLLSSQNTSIYLISGGFDCLIEPVAEELNISFDHIFANSLFFSFNGKYAGFDTNQPTSRSGGKAEAIRLIKQKYPSNYIVTMIGDGSTDLEASPPADYFIGYGGNIIREEVRNKSQYYATDFTQLYF